MAEHYYDFSIINTLHSIYFIFYSPGLDGSSNSFSDSSNKGRTEYLFDVTPQKTFQYFF